MTTYSPHSRQKYHWLSFGDGRIFSHAADLRRRWPKISAFGGVRRADWKFRRRRRVKKFGGGGATGAAQGSSLNYINWGENSFSQPWLECGSTRREIAPCIHDVRIWHGHDTTLYNKSLFATTRHESMSSCIDLHAVAIEAIVYTWVICWGENERATGP